MWFSTDWGNHLCDSLKASYTHAMPVRSTAQKTEEGETVEIDVVKRHILSSPGQRRMLMRGAWVETQLSEKWFLFYTELNTEKYQAYSFYQNSSQ